MFPDGVLNDPFAGAGSLKVYECAVLRKKPWPVEFTQRRPALLDEQRKTPNCLVVP